MSTLSRPHHFTASLPLVLIVYWAAALLCLSAGWFQVLAPLDEQMARVPGFIFAAAGVWALLLLPVMRVAETTRREWVLGAALGLLTTLSPVAFALTLGSRIEPVSWPACMRACAILAAFTLCMDALRSSVPRWWPLIAGGGALGGPMLHFLLAECMAARTGQAGGVPMLLHGSAFAGMSAAYAGSTKWQITLGVLLACTLGCVVAGPGGSGGSSSPQADPPPTV